MPRFFLGKAAVKLIHKAVESIFAKAKSRLFNRPLPREVAFNTKMGVQRSSELSLPGIFVQASIEERNKPNKDLLESLERVAEGYLDAHQEATKARVVHAVDTFLRDAEQKGVKTDVGTVLGGQLEKVFGKLKYDLNRIADTEATIHRNVGTMDGIVKVNAASGIDDPVVYFVVVKDDVTCTECIRLHLMPDKITPRCYYLSEVGNGYHKKGDPDPKIGGLHPHCRCSLVTLLPGYGFDASGHVQFIKHNHEELTRQR